MDGDTDSVKIQHL